MNRETYSKRTGTSGIQGQLYETKLISLIYFRMIHDNNINQFSLATNRDDIGAFDDICFKAKIKVFKKPVNVFIQAKHRETDKLLTFSKTDLAKYFDSYLEIRRAFDPSSKDMIFGGKFDETECFFVMYTTAKDDPNNKIYEGSFSDYLNKLIGTGGSCRKPSYTNEDLDFLCKIVMKEQITSLAEQFAKFICNESDSEMSMNNDLTLRYHVILAHNVLNISEIQPEGHRNACFRQDFFTTNEEFLVLFKNILCIEVLKKRKLEETDVESLLLKFFSEPTEVTILSKLLGSVLIYKNNKLEFVSKSMTDDLKQRQLDKANVSQSTVYEAAELAAKEYLLSLKLKVPSSFGNKDLTIRGNPDKIEKRLSHLTSKIIEKFEQSNTNNIVTLDESLGEGFLQLNGGIASAVGNILVFDESSKLLKFTDNCESLSNLSGTWYKSLKMKIENLHEYKLDVKVKKFPKLSFERGEYDVSLVKDFYDKLLFYTNQADQNGVEEILRKEIKGHPCNDIISFSDRSDLIFLKYHDKIQKLWMTPKLGSYLTNKSKIYQNAVTDAMREPLLGVLNITHKIKYKGYTFNENALYNLNILIETGTVPASSSAWISFFLLQEKRKPFVSPGQALFIIIVTESCELTVAKLEQQLGNKDRVVLDLEFIFKLSLENHNTLCKELTKTAKEKILIIVCRNIIDSKNAGKRLENIAKAVEGKEILFVTNNIAIDILSEYLSEYFSEFLSSSHLMSDKRCVFTDLSVESQKNFLATSKIKVQGDVVSLDTIGDVMSAGLIDEYVFSKLMNNETIEIGDMAIYNNHQKQFYIDRRVSRTKKQEDDKFDDVKDKVLKTFYDLEDDVVLITGELGMGKSTLLAHLSHKTKELDSKVWIVRINLPEHEGMVRILSESKNISIKEYLMLISKAAVCGSDVELRVSDGLLKTFQLKVFLHYFYNTRKLIFLFDGLDEIKISPKCKFQKAVIALKTLVWSIAEKHKVWITSRSLKIIEHSFGPSYKLENFSRLEQDTYLNRFWESKIHLKDLCFTEIMESDNIEFLTKTYLAEKEGHNEYLRGYALFLDFLKTESPAAGIDFPYDEYYNHFMSGFGLCDSKISSFPDDTTPRHLRIVAEYFVGHPLISRGLIGHFEISTPPPFPPHV